MGNQISSLRKPAAIAEALADARTVREAGDDTGDVNIIAIQSADIEGTSASLVMAAATLASASQPVYQPMEAAADDLAEETSPSLMVVPVSVSASQPVYQPMDTAAADDIEGISTSLVAVETSVHASQPESLPMDAASADLNGSITSLVAAATLASASQPMGTAADLAEGFSASPVALATPARASQSMGAATAADLEATSASLVATTPARALQQTPQPTSATARVGQLVTPSTIVKDGDYKTATFHSREHFCYIAREGERLLASGEAPEENCGAIRKVILKAKLVLQQLVDVDKLRRKNEMPGEADEYVIMESDVAGAWDFTRILMEEVDALFTEINDLKENGWQPLPEPADTPPRTPSRNLSIRRPLFMSDPNSPVARRAQETRDKFLQEKRLEVLRKKKQQLLEGEKGQSGTQNEGQQPT